MISGRNIKPTTPTALAQAGADREHLILPAIRPELPTSTSTVPPSDDAPARLHPRLPKMPPKRALVHYEMYDALLKSILDAMEATDCLRYSKLNTRDPRNGWMRFYRALHNSRDGILRGYDPKSRITGGSRPQVRQKVKAVAYLEECARVEKPQREQVRRAAGFFGEWKALLSEQDKARQERLERRLQEPAFAEVEQDHVGLTPGRQLAGRASTNTILSRTPQNPVAIRSGVVTNAQDNDDGTTRTHSTHSSTSGGTPFHDAPYSLQAHHREFLSNALNLLHQRFEGIDRVLADSREAARRIRDDSRIQRRIDDLFEFEKRARLAGDEQREQRFRKRREDLEDRLFSGEGW